MIPDPARFLRQLFDRAVEVADPMRSLAGFLPEKPQGRLIVIGAGKASARMAEAVEAASEDVKTGSGLGYALGRQKRFPRLAVHMVQVGEESGELDAMLFKVADTYDREAGDALERLLAVLVPAVIVLLTGVVGVIVLSVLLPIYDLTNAIG